MRSVWILVVCAAACSSRRLSEPDVFFDDEFFGDTGSACWEGSGVDGLARTVDGDVEVVFTPERPAAYSFDSGVLVSGGTAVSESVSEVEATWRVTPDSVDGPVVFELGVACQGTWVDTYMPLDWTFSVTHAALTEAWTPIQPQ
ncbi:MAG: hypothetical protein EP330_19250 [Deltaproteobacteria bacterium]|nr:MAG: hypothetical protein EP330_19250 [Deltaproteobacteria bacterium]